MKVLLVEDDNNISQVLTLLLGREGVTVINASDGIEGYSKAILERPDVIVTDIKMPRLDGIAMIEKIRQSPYNDRKRIA